MEAEMSATTDVWTKAADDIQQLQVAPKKSDVDVHLVALAWAPKWQITYQDARGLARWRRCRPSARNRGRSHGLH